MASKTTVGLAALRPEFAPVGTVGVAHGLGHLAREAKGRRVGLWISTEDKAEVDVEELAVFRTIMLSIAIADGGDTILHYPRARLGEHVDDVRSGAVGSMRRGCSPEDS